MPTYSASFGGRAGRAKGKTPKKKKSKIKCPLCGKNGHEEADCPRAQADSEDAEGVGARGGEAAKGGAGSGITHKTNYTSKYPANSKSLVTFSVGSSEYELDWTSYRYYEVTA